MSKIEVNTIDAVSGTSTLTLGSSNASTIALGSGDVQSNFLEPTFLVYLGSNQDSIPHATFTKVQFNTVAYQTGSTFDTSNYRWTPAVAGKYWIFSSVSMKATSSSQYYNLRKVSAQLYKNGSVTANPEIRMRVDFNDSNIQAATANDFTVTLQGTISLTATDYLEVFGMRENANGTNDGRFEGSVSYFGGYRIGT